MGHPILQAECGRALPPFAPELNSTEIVWKYLSGNKLYNLLRNAYDTIVQGYKRARDFLITEPNRIRSIRTRDWACVTL